ncbi:MAG: antitoxin [Thermoleophilaceae bacterium]
MPALTRRTQLLLDDERHERLRRHAEVRGTSVANLIREAIDRTFPGAPPDRARAARILLDAEPMPVDDWPAMKREMLDTMTGSSAEDEL